MRLECGAPIPCDHPIFMMILGKTYCAFCWNAWRRALPFTNKLITPALVVS